MPCLLLMCIRISVIANQVIEWPLRIGLKGSALFPYVGPTPQLKTARFRTPEHLISPAVKRGFEVTQELKRKRPLSRDCATALGLANRETSNADVPVADHVDDSSLLLPRKSMEGAGRGTRAAGRASPWQGRVGSTAKSVSARLLRSNLRRRRYRRMNCVDPKSGRGPTHELYCDLKWSFSLASAIFFLVIGCVCWKMEGALCILAPRITALLSKTRSLCLGGAPCRSSYIQWIVDTAIAAHANLRF
jgi:hypothetical protein